MEWKEGTEGKDEIKWEDEQKSWKERMKARDEIMKWNN